MNIFATSPCPIESAEYLDDIRATKMTLETAQLLATAINEHGGQATYKTTHRNHPVAIWARQTRSNYLWLLRHLEALCDRFERYRGKPHKCSDFIKEYRQGAKYIPDGVQTEFANCAQNKSVGISFKDEHDVCSAYIKYLHERWKRDTIKLTKYGKNICLKSIK